MNANDVIAIYGATWNEPDLDKRRELLEQSWSDDGAYCDPTGRAEGRDAFVAHITGFQQRFEGHRMELASGVDAHSGYLRFAWRMVGPDDTPVLEGIDFGELDDAGRLRRIVGFFGPLRRRPSSLRTEASGRSPAQRTRS